MADGAKLSKEYCELLADKLKSLDELPKGCQKYETAVEKVKAAAAAPDPFAGMAGGQAVSARSARSAGRENRAQLQRRLTRTSGTK